VFAAPAAALSPAFASAASWTPIDLLPGLYAGLLAWLLTAAVRRWYDRVPGWVVAAFVLAVLPVLGPVLFGGRVLLPFDNLRGHVPFTALPPTQPHGNLLQGDLIELVTPSLMAGREIWLTGCWPLWNNRVGAGMPLLADPQAQALQPLALAALPLPTVNAAGVIAALRLWTALLFTFLLLSSQGLGNGPALAGAFAFGLGGVLLLWLGWPLANSAALLPVVLYAIVRCDRHEGRRDRLLLAAATACLLLAGHPETVLYAAAFSLLFLLDRLRQRPARPASERRALLRATLPALLIGAGLAAPALLPTASYLPQSLRAARLRQAPVEIPAASPPPAGYQLSAPPRPAGSFLGELALRWLPIATPNAYGNSRFLYYWGASNTNEDASGFTGTATLLAVLLALAARRRLPQEGLALACGGICLLLLAAPWRGLLGGAMAATLLDSRRVLLVLAFCFSYVAACTWERFHRGELRRRPVLIAGAVLAALICWGYLAHADPTDPGRLVLLRMGWLRWQLRFLVAAALLAAATPRRWRRPATFLAAGLVAAELLLAHLPANPPAPKRLAFPPSAALDFLFEHHAEGRMAGLGRALPPNLASAYHLADARLYNPMAPAAYLDYIAPIVASWWGELPQFGFPASPLYSRLGVRYLLTAPGEALPPPWELAFADATARVYRRPRTEPGFALSAAREPGTSPEQALDLLRFDGAWFSFRAPRVAAGSALVSSLYQDGGWRLLVDGRRQPVGAVGSAGGPFVAALVAAGRHRLDLLYRPRAFLLGCALAACAAAALYAGGVPPPRPLRRDPPTGRDGSTINA
jgi:hypothetical protein